MSRPARVHLSDDLRDQGLQWPDVAGMVGSGELTRVRRGAYTTRLADSVEDRHRQLILATLPVLSGEAVLSHASAALWYGLPTWSDSLDRVHVSRFRAYGGRRNEVVHVHTARLGSDDVAMVDGVAITGIARTVLDCARTFGFQRGVAVADAALMAGLTIEELELRLADAQAQNGIRRA